MRASSSNTPPPLQTTSHTRTDTQKTSTVQRNGTNPRNPVARDGTMRIYGFTNPQPPGKATCRCTGISGVQPKRLFDGPAGARRRWDLRAQDPAAVERGRGRPGPDTGGEELRPQLRAIPPRRSRRPPAATALDTALRSSRSRWLPSR